MKKLSYNEQMKTNGGRKICFGITGYLGTKVLHTIIVNNKITNRHTDYYMGKSGSWYNYGK